MARESRRMTIPFRPVPRVASCVATQEEAAMVRHPKTLIEFMQMYPTEEDCREALFEHRWPQGFSCRRCGHEKAWYLRGRGLYECAGCHYQGPLTAGTVLSCTRTDLRKWFLAIWLLASTKKAPSAAELARQLGVTRKTAWLMRRKIIHAMARREGELLLRGIVELDEGFIGGRRPAPESRGRRQPGRALVAMAAEHTKGGGLGCAHLRVVADASAASLSGRRRRPSSPAASCRPTAGPATLASREPAMVIFRAICLPAPTSISGYPGRTSCSPTSSAGRSTSSTGSAPPTCRPTSTSTATGSTAAGSARTSSGACSIAASCTAPRRLIPCSRAPE